MGQSSSGLVDGESIKRVKGGRMYKIVTREYMAQGHDGFLPLKGQKYLVDDESGQLMSSIVRKYLLGKQPLLLLYGEKVLKPHRLSIREQALAPGKHAPRSAA